MSENFYSDLRMMNYVVTQLQMQVDPTHELTADQGSLSLDFNVRQKPESDDDFLLELTVAVNSDDEDYEERGFRFLCSVAGFFELHGLKEAYPDSWEPRFLNNGLSILYGVARVQIDSISAVAPMGRFVLPCVNMKEFLTAQANSDDEDAFAATKP